MIKGLMPGKIAVAPKFFPEMSTGEHGKAIYIPDTARPRINQGIVKYIGKDCKLVKVGDYVCFSAYTGVMFELEGEGLVIIFEEEAVTAVVDVEHDTPIPGLYFQDPDGNYFEADYEIAMQYITDAIEPIKAVEKERPKHEVRRGRESVRVK